MKRESGLISLILILLVITIPVFFFSYRYLLNKRANEIFGANIEKLSPTDDASVSSTAPEISKGSETKLNVSADPKEITYLKFNLANLAGKDVMSAQLNIYIENGKNVTQKVKLVDSSNWNESTLNFNNKPLLGANIANISTKQFGKYLKLDLTNAVKQNIGGYLSIGIEHTKKVGYSVYASKESVGNQPFLDVLYDDGTVPTPEPTPIPEPTLETGYCGDGVRKGTEECDGSDFGGLSCQSLGYTEGSVSCSSTCLVVRTACTSGSTSEIITVDYSKDNGPVTNRATGFIGAFTDTQPPSSLYLAVKPKLHSWNTSYGNVNRTLQNGIRFQLKLHNMSLIPSTATGDWSKWENHVKAKAQEALNKSYTNVEFDIWNEPEFESYWVGDIDERYYQMWNRAYKAIKGVSADFLVAGPSSTSVGWTKGAFFTRARADGTLPDVLTWHELNDGSNLYNNVINMRAHYRNNGLPTPKITINEYLGAGYRYRPGVIVRFMSEIERAQIRNASKACWQEGGTWNCEIHMDNTITYPDQKPRSAWWAYKSYADMSGIMSSVYNSNSFKGIASKDSNLKKGYILIGNTAASTDVNINVININQAPFYSTGSTYLVDIKRIPNTDANPLTAPISISQNRITPNNNVLTIPLSNVQLYDAYFITITQ